MFLYVVISIFSFFNLWEDIEVLFFLGLLLFEVDMFEDWLFFFSNIGLSKWIRFLYWFFFNNLVVECFKMFFICNLWSFLCIWFKDIFLFSL